ncbi:MAG: C4-dicarboxylate ABC transporter permease [Bordetella sp. SCN 67-23]|nr:TRAP transporter small permease subunit [Burkholderiales bacterium]ODS69304.1 MAG: C4-dicarboxylate ABC transporter permease [Bordetella sp. SCN 67-23]ODU96201.1 MAG: C4-dicarboxylate ABC transporter permease [Bordetella sp. SCN 68-11]OJW89686.1 MAG: C4-dicarboxylate ABC transporter permease [Burkholderiales bacterium 67-32]
MSAAYGRLLTALAAVGCALLLAMMLVIVADVLLRNLAIAGLPRGLAWSNEVSEAMLYLITLFLAPWLLRQGQHIRVDIVLQAIPRRLAWGLEWLSDVLGLGCCLVIACYGAQSAWASYQSGAMNIKTLVTPEWWMLAPLPVVFLLLAVEMLFRMHRLLHAEAGPRNEAVSAS